jgi:putative ABC transport system substrate-binding protein
LVAVAAGAVTTPRVSVAQPAKKVPKVAYLSASSPINAMVEAFRQGLRELGYVEGRNILIEYRWAEGRFDRLPGLAAELVGLGVNVIVASNTPAALAAKNATSTIPIILVTSGDPVGSGLVASLARPGGNVTGLSLTPTPAISGKQLGLLKEAFPTLTHVAVLANPANLADGWPLDGDRTRRLDRSGLQASRRGRCESRKNSVTRFATMKNERVPALLVIADPVGR